MKTFQSIREARKPQGKQVHSSKAKVRGKNVPVLVYQDRKGFTAYIDGDMLDTFKSKSDAVKGAEAILKDLGR